MNYYIDIQHACKIPADITDELLRYWATLSIQPFRDAAELTLRLVNEEEITQLNHQYRKKDKATNVLSFPSSYPKDIVLDIPVLGDVIICPTILQQESEQLKIALTAHWAHIVIHGVLHLLGYDHIKDKDAMVMQNIEIKLLEKLGIDNPYIERG